MVDLSIFINFSSAFSYSCKLDNADRSMINHYTFLSALSCVVLKLSDADRSIIVIIQYVILRHGTLAVYLLAVSLCF
jgi:hypothetical protein